jgi:two-component system sensor histidine kinase CreC
MGLAIPQAVMVTHGGSILFLPSSQRVAFELEFPAV